MSMLFNYRILHRTFTSAFAAAALFGCGGPLGDEVDTAAAVNGRGPGHSFADTCEVVARLEAGGIGPASSGAWSHGSAARWIVCPGVAHPERLSLADVIDDRMLELITTVFDVELGEVIEVDGVVDRTVLAQAASAYDEFVQLIQGQVLYGDFGFGGYVDYITETWDSDSQTLADFVGSGETDRNNNGIADRMEDCGADCGDDTNGDGRVSRAEKKAAKDKKESITAESEAGIPYYVFIGYDDLTNSFLNTTYQHRANQYANTGLDMNLLQFLFR